MSERKRSARGRRSGGRPSPRRTTRSQKVSKESSREFSKASSKEFSVELEALRSEKLQKVLAGLGLGSRRQIEGWIEAGRVTVNGELATLGQRVLVDDRIRLDGSLVRRGQAPEARVLLLNKADGVVCSRRDPDGRPTCFDGLPKLTTGRWINVGRLDINTTGVLLLTNDGALAHRLAHPSTGLDREYAVRVNRKLNEVELEALKDGVLIDNDVGRFSDIRYYDGSGHNHWYHVVLMEGRHREVRRLFESQGARVSRLKRVRFGPVVMPSQLKRGRWLELSVEDVVSLYRLLHLPAPRVRHPARGGRQHGKRPASMASVLVPYPDLPLPKEG